MNANVVLVQDKEVKRSKRMPTARLPIEIEYWYVLPVLRSELAKCLKEQGKLKQKEIAKILGISESAISQYLKGTRATLEHEGDSISFPKWLTEAISESTEIILANKNDSIQFLTQMNQLIQKIRANPKSFLCNIHKAFGITEENCSLCIECKV